MDSQPRANRDVSSHCLRNRKITSTSPEITLQIAFLIPTRLIAFQDPFTNPNHHHLLGPPLSHHMPSDHLKRPLPVNGHNGHPKMPESPQNVMPHPGMLMPHSVGPSITSSSSSSDSSSQVAGTANGSDRQPSAHIIEEYLQTQINRWRTNNLEMVDLIGELLTVMPSEDQMQFMTGIMELIYKKRNNPEEEKQMRKFFLGGATGT